MDLLRLRQHPGASVVLGMVKALSFRRRIKCLSLSYLSLGQEFELIFLPFKDFCLCSSILFYNKASLIRCCRQSLASFI